MKVISATFFMVQQYRIQWMESHTPCQSQDVKVTTDLPTISMASVSEEGRGVHVCRCGLLLMSGRCLTSIWTGGSWSHESSVLFSSPAKAPLFLLLFLSSQRETLRYFPQPCSVRFESSQNHNCDHSWPAWVLMAHQALLCPQTSVVQQNLLPLWTSCICAIQCRSH